MTAVYIGIYLSGFILSLLFFIFFGKAIGFDYSEPKTYTNHDDWDSNEQAYPVFAIAWPITMTILSISGFFKVLENLTRKLIQKIQCWRLINI